MQAMSRVRRNDLINMKQQSRTGSGGASAAPLPLLPRRPWLIMCMRPRAPEAALDAACDQASRISIDALAYPGCDQQVGEPRNWEAWPMSGFGMRRDRQQMKCAHPCDATLRFCGPCLRQCQPCPGRRMIGGRRALHALGIRDLRQGVSAPQ